MTLDLERRRERRHGHGPLPGGPVSHHLAKAKQTPPERHDTSGVVLPDHIRQGDSTSSETSQRDPVVLEVFSYSLAGPSAQFLRDSVMEFPVYDGSMNLGSFRK
jgi:hypothetical protein